MTSTPTFIEGKQFESTLRRLIDSHDELYWAVAWGTLNPVAQHLLKVKPKLKQLVIGTHFHQTDPDLLAALQGAKNARVAPNSSAGTFHPKIYLFRTRSAFSLVLGSPNFTYAAFNKNCEAALLVEGKITEPLFVDVSRSVANAWNSAKPIDDGFLRSYRLKFNATKAARADLAQDLPINTPSGTAEYRHLLDNDWPEFVTRVKSDPYHDVEGRLAVMDQARVWFSTTPRFADMSEGQRKAIAGTYARKEAKPAGVPDLDWAWFGSMVGAGVFKGKVKSDPDGLSAALDCIPRAGAVNEDHYERFAKKFADAFSNEERGGRLATASRLLALKRPDYFVCVDSANTRKLAEAIGVKKAHLSLEGYWTHVIRPLTCSPWWLAKRPSNPVEGRIWDARMAFIDAFCYER
ncbi:phospholipase D family protein [Burkholderia pseudomallei]|uniref:phospholipase D family protein n=1 Tax=Burkholderia pseudomallei TaxID=28450 RepID=UPI0005106976|nr:phospholipase D family protein [Burkholderia pseudomallei]KGC43758.1 PLD-like domain protein [Burkholderia pseudomallei]